MRSAVTNADGTAGTGISAQNGTVNATPVKYMNALKGEPKMKVAEFDKMHLSIPMKDGETREEIEDKVIAALETVTEDFVASYTLTVNEYDYED